MRLDLLIAGIIILILGLAVSGAFGSLIMAVGILLLLYVAFSGDTKTPAEVARYVEPKPERRAEPEKPLKERAPKPRYRSAERAERELEKWDASKPAKTCPHCGATSNPPNARFCAECGSKL